jgi:hypothetical protein
MMGTVRNFDWRPEGWFDKRAAILCVNRQSGHQAVMWKYQRKFGVASK